MQVHSTKYDGSLHYQRTATLIREEPNLRVVYGSPGRAIHSYRGDYLATRHTLEWYWADRDYNLNIVWNADWHPHMHYINIATPATWSDGTVRFIDLDLDVIWLAATGEILLDDEDEFEEHGQKFGYSPSLVERCWQSYAEVRSLIERRVYPFDGSLLTWRPHGVA